MMSHTPFARSLSCPTSTRPDDFMMMNNNYLPGISRMNNEISFCRAPSTNGIDMRPQSVFPSDSSSVQPNLGSQNGAQSMNNTGMSDSFDLSNSVDNTDSLMTDVSESQEVFSAHGNILSTVSPITQTWPTSLCNSSQIQASSVSFTFTTPTQSYLYSPSLTATTQNRFQYSRATPHTFAPGCNAQWQHSVPRQIPWRCQNVESSNQGVSVFTGSQSSSVCSMVSSANMLGTSTFYSQQANHPVASCSETTRRPKRRHAVETVDETSPRTKIHLTEEKIANHLRELNLNQFSPPNDSEIKGCKGPETLSSMCSNFVDICADNKIPGQRKLRFSNSGLQTFGSENSKQRQTMCGCGVSQSSVCDHRKHRESQSACQPQSDNAEYLRHSQRQWHDFKLLEEKLEMIDEDSDTEEKSSSQPKLTIVEGINIAPTQSIPNDIMDKIRNPCREVILWSPPDPTVKKSPETPEIRCHGNSILQPCMDMMDESISPNTEQICTENILTEDSGMETDFMEDSLEL